MRCGSDPGASIDPTPQPTPIRSKPDRGPDDAERQEREAATKAEISEDGGCDRVCAEYGDEIRSDRCYRVPDQERLTRHPQHAGNPCGGEKDSKRPPPAIDRKSVV